MSDTVLIKDFRKVQKLNYTEAQNAKEKQRPALERKSSEYSSDLTGYTNLCLRQLLVTIWFSIFFLHERDPRHFAFFNERSHINRSQSIATYAILIF